MKLLILSFNFISIICFAALFPFLPFIQLTAVSPPSLNNAKTALSRSKMIDQMSNPGTNHILVALPIDHSFSEILLPTLTVYYWWFSYISNHLLSILIYGNFFPDLFLF